jgi:hypothetical protein
MQIPKLTAQGQDLIKYYQQMAEQGYERADNTRVDKPFSAFELKDYRLTIRFIFNKHNINTILDYGSGASDWKSPGFDKENNQSALQYFQLKKAFRYEPALNLDERQKADGVICFDVLEHIFVADIPCVLRDLFSYANKLVLINVACYPAIAQLPNGENAHVTQRSPEWWKGMIDSIAREFPHIIIYLICSTEWKKGRAFVPWSADHWLNSKTFVIND